MSVSNSHSHPSDRLLVTVWLTLLVLTIVEVILAYRALTLTLMLTTLLGLSLVKAGLIMAYFMHLRFERRSMVLALVPALVFCIAMMGILFPDSLRILQLGN